MPSPERAPAAANDDVKPKITSPVKDGQQRHDPSPKRKNSEAAAAENSEGKKKRRKVNHACVYCRRSHMTCDLQRPCARCVKRDIGHLCHDEPRDKPPKQGEIGVAEIAPAPGERLLPDQKPGPRGVNGRQHYGSNSNSNSSDVAVDSGTRSQLTQAAPVSPTQLQRQAPGSNPPYVQNFDWNNNGVHSQFQDMQYLHPNYMFNTAEVTDEYNLLNDFLNNSLLDDGGPYTTDAQTLFNDPLLATSSMTALASTLGAASNHNGQSHIPHQHPSQLQAGHEISRPSSTFPIDSRARDKFYMTAADPAGSSSAEDRLHKLLRAKYDAGMLKPFNYVKGYQRLNQYMSQNLSRDNQMRILKQLDKFRPKFREAMHALTDMQLVLVEMWFERSLMEYDRVFASMAIPACCWRRTGEIFRGNTEMAELIHLPLEKLRDGKLAIHEIIADDSLVSYWEKFGAIAFDQSQKAILTSCVLKRPLTQQNGHTENGDREGSSEEQASPPMETIRCCFSFTIRRDSHNIPSLIVGNFLPITPRGQ